MPASLKTIGKNVFQGCRNLTSVYAPIKFPADASAGDLFTEGPQADCVLYVPQGCADYYRGADGWQCFKNIKEFDSESQQLTEQVTVHVEKSGTLCAKVDSWQRQHATNLKITGNIDVDDIQFIRMLGGCYYKSTAYADAYDGHLQHLDLEEAKLVNNGKQIFAFISQNYGAYATIEDDGANYNLFMGMPHIQSVKLPNNMTSLGLQTFYACPELNEVVLPKSLKEIGNGAFCGCPNLTSVDFPQGLEYIRSQAFVATGLTSANLPSGIKNVETQAFCGTPISTLTLPASLESIGDEAFDGCSQLKTIYAYSATPLSYNGWDNNEYGGVDKSSCILYVPKGSLEAYQNTIPWAYFKNMVEMDGPSAIEDASLGSNVTEVGRYSLDGKLLPAPTKGINIVRYSNGTVRKVLVP